MKNISKEFYIKADVDVFKANYKKGEMGYVNYYKTKSHIIASDKNEAIEEFFSNNLGFDIDLKYLDFDEENNCFSYSVLCDYANCEISENSNLFNEWQKGKINLYNNNIQLSVYELNLIKELNKIDKTIDN